MTKQFIYKLLTIAFLLIIIAGNAFSQNYEASKNLSKSKGVSTDVPINIFNHSGDIKINTTKDKTVQIQTKIEVSAKDEEEANKIIKAIENFKFEMNGEVLEIDTRFYKSMQSVNNKTTIILLNGDKVRIKDFKIQHELNIPETAKLNLQNKYSHVYLESMVGETKLNLYSSKLTARDFEQEVTIESKYSKLQVENFNDETTLDFYDSDIDFKSSDDLEIKSKYSKIEGEKTGRLDINSYDDKFVISEFVELRMVAKYSDLVSDAIVDKLVLDLYDSNVTISSAEVVEFNGKYSDLKLSEVKELKITESYDNNIYMGNTRNLTIAQSKYSRYEIASVSKFDITGYDDNIVIDKLNSDFAGISLDGKYSKLEVHAGSVPFKIDIKMKYGKVDVPPSVKLNRHIQKNSELEMLSNNNGEIIMVRGYDMKVVIN